MSVDAEFDKLYQEMARDLKPLWTEEAKILPRTPQPELYLGFGNGRTCTGSRAGREN